MKIKTSQTGSNMIGDGLRASVPMSETGPDSALQTPSRRCLKEHRTVMSGAHGIGQLVREPRTFPHPLLTVRCSFKQRRLGVCRAESGSVSDTKTDARRPSPVMVDSVYNVHLLIRDTFTNCPVGTSRRPPFLISRPTNAYRVHEVPEGVRR